MTDYEDRLKEEAQFARDMEDLAKVAEANGWDRRLKQHIDRINQDPKRFVNERSVLKWRSRLIKNLLVLRPHLTWL